MKRKPANKRTSVAKTKPDGLAPLIAEVRQLIQSARRGVSSVIDTFQVMTNFEIGRRIVEHEQKGEKRAGYGKELLKGLSTRLTEEFGRGYSEDNLALMRRFFLVFTDRFQISETVSRKLGDQAKQQTPSGELAPLPISEAPSRKSPFTLSWSHYDRHVKLPEENATVGLLLCKEKKDAVVKLTLPKDANIHAREYQLYLPSTELLKAKLLEWARAEEARA